MGKWFHAARGMCSHEIFDIGEVFPPESRSKMSLLENTQTLLDRAVASGKSLRQIADDSKKRVEYEWLKKFAAGKIDNPGVRPIEGLHNTLVDLERPRRRRS
jgi:hypothetical protein